MAGGRQRVEWERTSWVMAWVGRMTGGPFEPHKLNPLAGDVVASPRPRTVSPEREAAMGWAMLGAGLKQMAGRRG